MTSQAGTPSNTLGRAPVYRLIDHKDDATKTLAKLLGQNHAAHAVLRDPRLLFHNHVPHALGSSYLLGASSTKLEEIYAGEALNLTAVDGSILRNAITHKNWRVYLGQKKYTAVYVNYFDSKVEKNGRNWNKVVEDYLYLGIEILINRFSGGHIYNLLFIGHPFIYLTYGYKFDYKEVITKALSLSYSLLPDNSIYKITSLAEVLERLHNDNRFNGYSEHLGFANIFALLPQYKSEILEHWNALMTAAELAVNTVNAEGGFDFYLAYILTVGHALRILLPLIPEQHRIPIINFGPDTTKSFKTDHLSWDAIYKSTLESKWSNDVHWPKVVRALKVVEELRGAEDGFYKLAAAKFIAEFDGWTGFGLGVDAIH
ncbi:MGS207 protein [Ilyonectria destructans]|nr:MGS207 protein [Ilyonectria destructans]